MSLNVFTSAGDEALPGECPPTTAFRMVVEFENEPLAQAYVASERYGVDLSGLTARLEGKRVVVASADERYLFEHTGAVSLFHSVGPNNDVRFFSEKE
ncbi:MAG: hypothetical protein UT33_C0009G0102 [Candidatus Peregrinibacteria bacterium GW2011_GWC2_39_14]|nr:MAG: hypothetical protein US92_C0005G0102 [Candidatus Peregrinibacteria bacterium GW2011_GWA2_38_36]KKR06651.1 MAG: hypothetical protein UT33_C0009G0102 [Candidatus Peregrinibacteria bacterium GW2011_GWC2_39_14]